MDDDYIKRSVFHELYKQEQGYNNRRKLQKSAKSKKLKIF